MSPYPVLGVPPLLPIPLDYSVAFIRLGTDFSDNYYQVEIPLKVTQSGSSSEYAIWPKENQFSIPMEVLTKLKAISIRNQTLDRVTYYDANYNVVSENTPYHAGENRYVIKGNPSSAKIGRASCRERV